MSLVAERLKALREEGRLFVRDVTGEEKEIKELFPDLDELDLMLAASEFSLWKSSIKNTKKVTFKDFLYRFKEFDLKDTISDEMKARVMKSIGAVVKSP